MVVVVVVGMWCVRMLQEVVKGVPHVWAQPTERVLLSLEVGAEVRGRHPTEACCELELHSLRRRLDVSSGKSTKLKKIQNYAFAQVKLVNMVQSRQGVTYIDVDLDGLTFFKSEI